MRATVWIAIIAASVFGIGAASAACPPGQSKNCVDLDSLPQITQQIVAKDSVVGSPKAVPFPSDSTTYSGPTVGVSSMARRAPTVGYRWSIN